MTTPDWQPCEHGWYMVIGKTVYFTTSIDKPEKMPDEEKHGRVVVSGVFQYETED